MREHSKQRQHSHKERRKCASYRASKRPIATVGRGSSASGQPFPSFREQENCYGVDRLVWALRQRCVDCYTGKCGPTQSNCGCYSCGEAPQLSVVTHASNRAIQATFFRTLGYDSSNWQVLEADLRSLLLLNAEQLDVTEYGRKYAVTGSITGPNGRLAEIVSVWIILAGEEMPRFVTAYPKDKP